VQDTPFAHGPGGGLELPLGFVGIAFNRIEDPRFEELYQRIDRLRGAITARTTAIAILRAVLR